VQYAIRRDLMFEAAYVGSRGLNLIRDLGDQPSAVSQPAKPRHQRRNRSVDYDEYTRGNERGVRAPFQGVEVGISADPIDRSIVL